MFKVFFTLILLFSLLFATTKNDMEMAQKLENNGDIKQALYYYFKAAKDKDEKALLYLGKIYFEGKIVNKSITTSIQYLKKAILLGSTKAKYNLAIIYTSKLSNGFQDYKKAYNIFLELSNKGYAPAQNKLGIFLTHGIGEIKKDYNKAIKYFELSAKQCYEDAECNLAYMYANGYGVWKNFGRAHNFAKDGVKNSNSICKQVWEKNHLYKYPEDKGFKFNFFVKPCKN